MTEFRVDPEELDELAAELRRRRDRLVEGREELATAARTVREGWSGEARERFVEAHVRWEGGHRAQVEALAGAADLAAEAAVTYREVDRAVAEMFE
ncbi:hypothetical protein LLS1_30600 [Leifsonia sp. LS1]|uniref:WXG100 family type VII secretion target n=1 Tax=Leifsonia sp. LS1 TaxID=2828483 RepID=UPI001CFE41F6|nr:WXG100 family type VII secretion target [Leifsonia sp. LS1]GIT81391.1 hypothetical protein LLS1_30600 [Leifsonia sp. LS1]